MINPLQKLKKMEREEKWWKSTTTNLLSLATWFQAYSIILLLFFKDIPDHNKEILNITLGIIIGATLQPVYSYFFGKSKPEAPADGIVNSTTVTETKTENGK